MNPRWLLIPVLAVFGFAVYWFDVLAFVAEPEQVRDLLRDSGPWGALLYVLAFTLIEPLGVPGIVFIGPATQIWDYWTVVGLSVAGAVGAGCVVYVLARWVAREWFQARLPERVRRFTAHAEERPFRTVILVRAVLFLAAPAHWALGLSQIRFAPFFFGSIIGFTPPMMALVYGTEKALEALEGAGLGTLVAVGIAILMAFGLFKWWSQRPAPADARSEED